MTEACHSLWSFSQLRRILVDQWDLAKEFLRSPVLFLPVLIVWLAFFGDGVHSSVLTFYYLQMGASETEIGVVGTYIDLGYLFSAPLAGYAMDKYGPHLAICAGCLFCGFGCGIRAMATNVYHLYLGCLMIGLGGFHITIVALISKHTPRRKRTLAIGGYQIQLTLLGIFGKFFYPIWHMSLEYLLQNMGIFTDLLRDRITLSFCAAVCVTGATFLFSDDPAKYLKKGKGELEEEGDIEMAKPNATGKAMEINESKQAGSCSGSPTAHTASKAEEKASFTLLACAVVLLGVVLWPLYLRDTMDWGSRAYSCLLLVHSITAIFSLALVPSVEAKLGKFGSIYGYSVLGTVSASAFWLNRLAESYFLLVTHVLLAITFYASTAALDTSLSSLASLNTPPSFTARTFGVLALLAGIGSIFGNLAGTYLYSISSVPSEYIPYFLAGGTRLPFLVVVLMLVGCIGCVSLARIQTSAVSKNTDCKFSTL